MSQGSAWEETVSVRDGDRGKGLGTEAWPRGRTPAAEGRSGSVGSADTPRVTAPCGEQLRRVWARLGKGCLNPRRG